jgi:hypothetical protein
LPSSEEESPPEEEGDEGGIPDPLAAGLCWQPTQFFDYSQKAAYTPSGIMRNHCHFLLIDIRFIFRDNFNSILFVVFHNCKCENTSFR